MQYTKNTKFLYYDYNQIYSVLASKFELNSNQINELVKGMVKEHYKLEIDTTYSEIGGNRHWWRNIIN